MRKHSILIGLLTVAIVTGMNWLTIVHAKEELTFTPLVRPFAFVFKEPKPDYEKLCKAIAVAETSGCTDGTAIKRKNCHGIMAWKKVDGKTVRYPRYFNSYAESQAACVALWKRAYVHFPDMALATKYTGGDDTETWLKNVIVTYNSL